MRQVLDVYELLDRADASGEKMEEYLRHLGAEEVEVTTIEGPKGKTDMIRVTIPGTNGKSAGGKAPTLGVLGRLGGLGAQGTSQAAPGNTGRTGTKNPHTLFLEKVRREL